MQNAYSFEKLYKVYIFGRNKSCSFEIHVVLLEPYSLFMTF
jgi:hypothetical protein